MVRNLPGSAFLVWSGRWRAHIGARQPQCDDVIEGIWSGCIPRGGATQNTRASGIDDVAGDRIARRSAGARAIDVDARLVGAIDDIH